MKLEKIFYIFKEQHSKLKTEKQIKAQKHEQEELLVFWAVAVVR